MVLEGIEGDLKDTVLSSNSVGVIPLVAVRYCDDRW